MNKGRHSAAEPTIIAHTYDVMLTTWELVAVSLPRGTHHNIMEVIALLDYHRKLGSV
jgi:hypothetical protein